MPALSSCHPENLEFDSRSVGKQGSTLSGVTDAEVEEVLLERDL